VQSESTTCIFYLFPAKDLEFVKAPNQKGRSNKMKPRFHVTLMASLFALTLWGIDTSRAGPPEWPECVTDGLTQGIIGPRTIDGQNYFVRRMVIIFNGALDDFGASAVADSLEIFCVSRRSSDRFGKIAMCLTGERCPWREQDQQRDVDSPI
jgi:hypothetical protein